MALIEGTNNNDSFELEDNLSSDDTVYLGGGDDTYTLGNGSDTVSGGEGNDRIISLGGYYNSDPDQNSLPQSVFGESGNDFISVPGSGAIRGYGGDGNDTINGSSGNDSILGGNNDDYLNASRGNDRIYGEEGNDLIDGGDGNDTLLGGNGNDTLTGSSVPRFSVDNDNDQDFFYGGGGADTFVLGDGFDGAYYTTSGSNDIAYIEDFQSGEDDIQLTNSPDYYFLQVSGGNTTIYYDTDNDGLSYDVMAIVKDNTSLDINSSDFTFGVTT